MNLMKVKTVSLMLLALSACGSEKIDSQLKVTNGVEGEILDPSVVLLHFEGNRICTGTFVSDRMVLTAAHCVADVKVAELSRLERVDGRPVFHTLAKSERMVVNPNYRDINDFTNDLALIFFPSGTSKHWLSLSTTQANAGDEVRIIGYGYNSIKRDAPGYEIQEEGVGKKRSGYNQLRAVQDGSLQLRGILSEREGQMRGVPVGRQVGMGGGDSGGPLLNSRGLLQGVASTQRINWGVWESIDSIDSLYVDLSSPSSKSFLAKYLSVF